MAERLQRHITIPVNQDGITWSYNDLYINETSDTIDVPRSLILTNKSTDADFQVKIIPYGFFRESGDGDESADVGYLLKQDGQIQLASGQGSKLYRVGVRSIGTSASAQSLVVSLSDFVTIRKVS